MTMFDDILLPKGLTKGERGIAQHVSVMDNIPAPETPEETDARAARNRAEIEREMKIVSRDTDPKSRAARLAILEAELAEQGGAAPKRGGVRLFDDLIQQGASVKKESLFSDLFEPEEPASPVADTAKSLASGVVTGTGAVARGMGEAFREGGEWLAMAVNKALGTELRAENPLSGIADWVEGKGKQIADSRSKKAQRAERESTPRGNLLDAIVNGDFSGVDMGEAPSALGYTQLAANVFGQMAPIIVGTILAKRPMVTGSVLGGAQGGGAAAKEAAEGIRSLTPEQLERVPLYSQLLEGGAAPDQALQQTADAAARFAFLFTTPISALGGAATGAIIRGALGKAAGSRLASIPGSMAEEAVQETAEGVATIGGMNVATGTEVPLGEGSQANAVLGAMGGAGPGAIGAMAGGKKAEAPQPDPVVSLDFGNGQIINSPDELTRLFASLAGNERLAATQAALEKFYGAPLSAEEAAALDESFKAVPLSEQGKTIGEAIFGPSQEAAGAAPAAEAPPAAAPAPVPANALLRTAKRRLDDLHKKAIEAEPQLDRFEGGQAVYTDGTGERLTTEEQEEYEFLKASFKDAAKVAQRYGVQLAPESPTKKSAEGSAEKKAAPAQPAAAPKEKATVKPAAKPAQTPAPVEEKKKPVEMERIQITGEMKVVDAPTGFDAEVETVKTKRQGDESPVATLQREMKMTYGDAVKSVNRMLTEKKIARDMVVPKAKAEKTEEKKPAPNPEPKQPVIKPVAKLGPKGKEAVEKSKSKAEVRAAVKQDAKDKVKVRAERKIVKIEEAKKSEPARFRPEPKTAAEWAREMAYLRSIKPSPIAKMFGKNGPTKEQRTRYDADMRSWNERYRHATRMQKEALVRDNDQAAVALVAAKADKESPEAVMYKEAVRIMKKVGPTDTPTAILARELGIPHAIAKVLIEQMKAEGKLPKPAAPKKAKAAPKQEEEADEDFDEAELQRDLEEELSGKIDQDEHSFARRTSAAEPASAPGLRTTDQTNAFLTLQRIIDKRIGKIKARGLFDLVPADTAEAREAQKLVSRLGKKAYFFRNNKPENFNFDGVAPKGTDYIFINVDGQRTIMATVGHELLHKLRQDSEETYQALRVGLIDYFNAKGVDEHASDLMPILKSEGVNVEKFKFEEEFIADAVGRAFMDKEFWTGLAQQTEPSMFRSIVKAVLDFLHNLMPTRGNEFFTDVRKAHRAILDAFAEWQTANPSPEIEGSDFALPMSASEYRRRYVGALEEMEKGNSREARGAEVLSMRLPTNIAQARLGGKYILKQNNITGAFGNVRSAGNNFGSVPDEILMGLPERLAKSEEMYAIGSGINVVVGEHNGKKVVVRLSDRARSSEILGIDLRLPAQLVSWNRAGLRMKPPAKSAQQAGAPGGVGVNVTSASVPAAQNESKAEADFALRVEPKITVKVDDEDVFIQLGKNNTGMLAAKIKDGVPTITNTWLAKASKGQGLGVRMYTIFFNEMAKRGFTKVQSDSVVSNEALRVYESLQRSGFDVTVNENKKQGEMENTVTTDGKPLYEVSLVKDDTNLDFTNDADFARRTFKAVNSTLLSQQAQAIQNSAPQKKRLELGIGRRALKLVNDWAGDRMSPLGSLPDAEGYLVSRGLTMGVNAAAQEEARRINEIFNAATDAEKKQIYTYWTNKSAPKAMITNSTLADAAEKVKNRLIEIGEKLVERGVLNQKDFATNKGKYLPRLYLRHLLDEKAWRGVGTGKKLSDLGYSKKRQDIPEAIRLAILGEIRDPAYLGAVAVGKPLRDIALLDFLQQISKNQEWVWAPSITKHNGKTVSISWLKNEIDRVREQITYYTDPKIIADAKAGLTAMEQTLAAAQQVAGNKAPDDYMEIPDLPRYGLLRGMYVRKEIHNDLVGAAHVQAQDWAENLLGYGGIGTKVTQAWKASKVSLNPPAQIRNFISNLMLLHLSGVALHRMPMRIAQAINSIVTKDKYHDIALKYGVTVGTFAAQELYHIREEFLADKGAGGPLALLRYAKIIASKAGDAYQLMETLGKTAKIIDEMETYGQNEANAAIEANKWLFDYTMVPKSVRYLRNAPMGMPFITFYYKLAPRLMEVALKYPWRFAPYVAAAYLIPQMVAGMGGPDADDQEKLKLALAEWLREKGHVYVLPEKDANGNWTFVDLSYLVPWTMFTEAAKQVGKGDASKAVKTAGLFSGPITNAVVAIETNKDPFTGRDIANPGDPVGLQVGSWLTYLYNLMMPPIITTQNLVGPDLGNPTNILGGRLPSAIYGTTNKYGDPKNTVPQAVLGAFGINIYPVNLDNARTAELSRMSFEIQETMRVFRQKMYDRALTDEQRQEIIDTYVAEINRRQQKMQEYAEKSSLDRIDNKPGVTPKEALPSAVR